MGNSARPIKHSQPMAERKKSKMAARTELEASVAADDRGERWRRDGFGWSREFFVYKFLLVNWCAGVSDFRPGILMGARR